MPTVIFQDDDLTVEATDDANLRDVAMEEGASIPFGCEQGICGTCLIDVPVGAENLSDVDEQEQETLQAMGGTPGQRLACQCQVNGNVTVASAH